MTVGENIRKIRKEKKLTQKKLGLLSGINEVQIRQYELGKANPKIETIKKIADALGTSYLNLLGAEELKQRMENKGSTILVNWFDWVLFYSGIYETYSNNYDLYYKWFKKTTRQLENYVSDTEVMDINIYIPFPGTEFLLDKYLDFLYDLKFTLENLKRMNSTLEEMHLKGINKDNFIFTIEQKRQVFIFPNAERLYKEFGYIDTGNKVISNDYYRSLPDEEIEIEFNKLVNELKLENEKFKKALGLITEK